jgi:hypothetical protein
LFILYSSLYSLTVDYTVATVVGVQYNSFPVQNIIISTTTTTIDYTSLPTTKI